MLASIKDVLLVDKDKILGEGAFSEVVKVRLKKDNKIYALKKIDSRHVSKEDLKNLQGEIQLHKSIDHKHIIHFYDNIQENNMVYFLLEYAGNGNLFFFIHSLDGLPEKLALRFFYQTALAVKYLHDRNIIHRDIKPENILLDEQFNIKLCDMGWGCVHQEGFRKSICGTYEYMSPEIVLQHQHNSKVDIWCLGILLYEMLHGTPPFEAENLTDIKNELKNLNIMINEDLHPDTKGLLQYLLKTDANSRYSIDQVLKHPAMTENLKYFNSPINEEDFQILIKNYLINTGTNENRCFPDALSEILESNPRLKMNGENLLNSLRKYVEANFKTQRHQRSRKKVSLNMQIQNKTKIVQEVDYDEYMRHGTITFKKKNPLEDEQNNEQIHNSQNAERFKQDFKNQEITNFKNQLENQQKFPQNNVEIQRQQISSYQNNNQGDQKNKFENYNKQKETSQIQQFTSSRIENQTSNNYKQIFNSQNTKNQTNRLMNQSFSSNTQYIPEKNQNQFYQQSSAQKYDRLDNSNDFNYQKNNPVNLYEQKNQNDLQKSNQNTQNVFQISQDNQNKPNWNQQGFQQNEAQNLNKNEIPGMKYNSHGLAYSVQSTKTVNLKTLSTNQIKRKISEETNQQKQISSFNPNENEKNKTELQTQQNVIILNKVNLDKNEIGLQRKRYVKNEYGQFVEQEETIQQQSKQQYFPQTSFNIQKDLNSEKNSLNSQNLVHKKISIADRMLTNQQDQKLILTPSIQEFQSQHQVQVSNVVPIQSSSNNYQISADNNQKFNWNEISFQNSQNNGQNFSNFKTILPNNYQVQNTTRITLDSNLGNIIKTNQNQKEEQGNVFKDDLNISFQNELDNQKKEINKNLYKYYSTKNIHLTNPIPLDRKNSQNISIYNGQITRIKKEGTTRRISLMDRVVK